MSATTGYRRFEEELDADGRGRAGERPHRRPVDPPAAGALLHRRSRSCASTGCASLTRHAARARKDPGVAALGATNKMFWSEMHRDAMELALDIFGADVDADRHRSRRRGSWPASARRNGRDDYPVSPMMCVVLLLPLRDDLGRHRRDPAQHRRRAGPSACPRNPGSVSVLVWAADEFRWRRPSVQRGRTMAMS